MGMLPSGEEWSINPCFRISPAGGAVSYEQCLAIASAVAELSLPTTLRGMMSASTTYTGARVEARQYNGDLEAIAEDVRDTPQPGTSSSIHPMQTAYVFSLRAAVPGASGRGRAYWPATGIVLDTDTLRPTTAIVSGILTGAVSLFVALNAAVRVTFPGAVGLSMWSRKNADSSVVTKILCGDVVDTQRRRRDTLTEAYQTSNFPGP
jgi:hypothetical protein